MDADQPNRRPIFRLYGDVDGHERVFELSLGSMTLGSDAENDIRLSAVGVSRRHARLQICPDGLVIQDLESKNGTWVDGSRVARAAAGHGSRLAFGPLTLHVETIDEPALLAIRFESSDQPSSLSDLERSETVVVETADERDDDWDLIDGVIRRLPSSGPTLPAHRGVDAVTSSVFDFVADRMVLDGICAVRWSRTGEPLALDSWGRLAELPTLERIRALPTPLDDEAHWHCGQFATGAVVARAPSTMNELPIGLMLWSAEPSGVSSRCLRLLLRLLLPRWTGTEDHRAAIVTEHPRLVFPDDYVVGVAPEMKRLYRDMAAVCRLRQPVLLHGETGVGKEMLARTLHDSASRESCRGSEVAPYVVVNCAAIPESLLEAEMFGVVRGAATGVEPRQGYFARASGGTLFLDEIGELAPSLQAKLLRVLQTGEIQPVGGAPRAVDVWVIAATHVELDSGRLRRDLYYRLAGGLLDVPSLRRCREDIPALARHFLWRCAEEAGLRLRGVTARAVSRLQRHDWPGNVRELAHVMQRLVALAPANGIIDLDDLPETVRRSAGRSSSLGEADDEPLGAAANLAIKPRVDALERRLIRTAMTRTGGHRMQAAALLGVSRGGLAKKLKRLGLETTWARPVEGEA
ncbi:MAG: sigma 54-interacting transcriptional regulator [Acidobacteriota bacterium]